MTRQPHISCWKPEGFPSGDGLRIGRRVAFLLFVTSKDAERPRDEPPGQPRLVSRRNRHLAGRVGSIELLGGAPG